ncbi:J domain-containing protein [Cupriavidus basilensis]
MHTHYDNLKISREAPPEVIRAAYKALSQKHHPDRNNGSPESHRNMTIINTAYEVLIDPVRRAQHDAWILAQEQAERAAKAAATQARTQARPAQAASPSPSSASAKRAGPAPRQAAAKGTAKPKAAPSQGGGSRIGKVGAMIIAGAAIYAAFSPSSRAPDHAARAQAWTPTASSASAPLPAREQSVALPALAPRYARKPTAPNGYPWPNRTGYVPGYPVLKTEGLSTLTIDNTRNDADVFLKVFSLSAGGRTPVRFALIRAGTSFEIAGIAPGNFDVRYMDLDTGRISRSEPFALDETAQYNGTQYSKTTLTLYKVANGNTRMREIGEGEF